MAEFGKSIEFKRELTVIYLDENTDFNEWLGGDVWIGLLYGEILYSAREIIYKNKKKSPMANIVSVTYENAGEMELPVVQNTQLVLTDENLQEHLERVLQYAEEREMYEDCAMVRDMLIDHDS